jgi:hypothetical protein
VSITVNGTDWTPRFEVTADQASYTTSADDVLIAGVASTCNGACGLTIQITVTDTAGGTAAATQRVDVVPVFEAVMPQAAQSMDTITIAAKGLDPSPANNSVIFKGVGTTTVSMSAVDTALGLGTVTVPYGVVTGPLSLVVSHGTTITAAEHPVFNISQPLPNCGLMGSWNAGSWRYLPDGGAFVSYGGSTLADGRCLILKDNTVQWSTSYVAYVGPDSVVHVLLPILFKNRYGFPNASPTVAAYNDQRCQHIDV